MRYVIVYINGRTVQGHRVYCLASRVNIRECSKGNCQTIEFLQKDFKEIYSSLKQRQYIDTITS